MPTRNTLTSAEVDALFAGTPAIPRPSQVTNAAAPPWSARYDRCACCRALQPALLTFTGSSDWSPWIGVDDPLRAEIATLRVLSGRRTILLCVPCIEALRSARPLVVSGGETPRLFED